jgi:hypothetical protein
MGGKFCMTTGQLMPIFGRRQLQRMLDELGPWLDRGKAKDLLNRLENEKPNQALPAEYEMSISWAVSRIATLEIDRPAGTRTPDIYSPDLLTSGPLIVDVAAVDDLTLSGADTMRRARNIINAEANRLFEGSSEHLHYSFRETSGYEPSRDGKSAFCRRRLVRHNFQLDESLRTAMKRWLASGRPAAPLHWNAPDISVVIEWREYVHWLSNFFCTMPSLAYDMKDNPLYAALRLKSKQLRAAPDGARRAVFLGDAGCSLLRDLNPFSPSSQTFSGGQIILKFLDDYQTIDFVMVFSAKREPSSVGRQTKRIWNTQIFARPSMITDADLGRLTLLSQTMMPPNLGGYQAYSWHTQGMCDADAVGKYVPTSMGIGRDRLTLKISARAVQELMAGRLSLEQFHNWSFGEANPVRREIEAGRTISSVRFEPQGDSEEDDYLVFEFRDDPSARALRMPPALKQEKSL